MPKITLYKYDPNRKRYCPSIFDTDKSIFLCQVPGGKLYRRKQLCVFFIYNPRGKDKKEKIRVIPYNEAKELVRVHGTKELYCEYFTVLNADGSQKKKSRRSAVYIDPAHKIRLQRTAALLGVDMTRCIQLLIDKYDSMDHHHLTQNRHRKSTITPNANTPDLY